MFLYKSEGKQTTEFHDLYCEKHDKQNWFFSVSCVEESFKNFRQLHPHIIKAKLWTDNGTKYEHVFVFWVPKLTETTGLRVSNFRNFEPQTAKTRLDSHYATMKFSLKQCRREGNDVTSGDDIDKGTFKRLRGTHVYGAVIIRKEKPDLAKTLKGISEYSDFEQVYNGSTFSSIKCRFQTKYLKRPSISRNTDWNCHFSLPFKNSFLRLQVIQTLWTRALNTSL